MIVIYRACSIGNRLKKRPIQGKYELVKTCFTSFIKAFQGVNYELVVLLDKPTAQFREIFKGYRVEESYYADFNEGNIKSFHRQIDLALEKKDNFLFVEDDYYFLPNSGKIIENTLHVAKNLFITPYDHPGYYDRLEHNYPREIKIKGNHHWQTIASTTLTFGGTYDALKKEAGTMKKYGWADHPMWLDVTKRIPLISPIPSLATHMETEFLSPTLNRQFA